MLDDLLHPHSSIPYVQIGRSIALYTVSLLSRDSCERAVIMQFMFLSLSSSCHRLAFMCVFHVSFFDRYGGIVEIYWLTGVSSFSECYLCGLGV